MQTSKRYGRQDDSASNKRAILLGIAGFIILGLICFGLGYLYLGPKLNLNSQVASQANQKPVYTPPTVDQNTDNSASNEDDQAQLDVQVTDHPNSEKKVPSESDIQKDENVLTVRLDPADKGDVQVAVSNRKTAKTTQASAKSASLATSRSATESKTLFRVQAGTFADRMNAQKLASDLKAHGYGAHIKTIQSDKGIFYRVQVGAFSRRADADVLINDLSAHAYTPSMIVDSAGSR